MRQPLVTWLAIGTGSALGGGLRWQLSLWLPVAGFPWATFIANASGALLIGLYAGLLRDAAADPLRRQFVMTGFCGGYTTFSLFSLETVAYLQSGELASAGTYAGLSLVSWLVGISAGFALGGVLAREG